MKCAVCSMLQPAKRVLKVYLLMEMFMTFLPILVSVNCLFDLIQWF